MTDERLDVPDVVEWPIFPFEGDFRVRALEDVHDEEYPRSGEPDGQPCFCETGEEPGPLIWTDGCWEVRRIAFYGREAPFPAYMLQSVDHFDFGDMDEEQAAGFGVMSLRVERAMAGLPAVGRVHINRWGDGGSHLHVWFLGRPKGAWQFSGFALPLWGFILPPLDEAALDANDAAVFEALAAGTEGIVDR